MHNNILKSIQSVNILTSIQFHNIDLSIRQSNLLPSILTLRFQFVLFRNNLLFHARVEFDAALCIIDIAQFRETFIEELYHADRETDVLRSIRRRRKQKGHFSLK